MSKIKIETLTPIHIGSGVFLQKGNDFVCGRSVEGDDVIGIVNLRKVLQLIGEENLSAWVAAIERKSSVNEIVRRFAPRARIEDYADRVIMRWSETTPTLKEFIHDGLGRPYIPGSSIKGAIRSAVLAIESREIQNKENLIVVVNRDGRSNITAKNVENMAFGKNPNEDVFRFLQVGDAIFGHQYEAAVRLVNLNERTNNSFWDESKSQLVEVLVDEDEAFFDIKICREQYIASQEKVHAMPQSMNDIPTLFSSVNAHTLSLLESEIAYWKELLDDSNADKVDTYLENLQKIKHEAELCSQESGSCVLRIGHGSGWRFITGAWTESLNNFKTVVVEKSRPKNYNYQEYAFPKSRRVDDECNLLGFARLSIVEV